MNCAPGPQSSQGLFEAGGSDSNLTYVVTDQRHVNSSYPPGHRGSESRPFLCLLWSCQAPLETDY